ncbi:hypothetical protein [Lutibacter sp.]|uniref:hypothetical protein n=1 Tax=Lutibacter sp. TaxID=1925666 RepID=UPI0034A04285
MKIEEIIKELDGKKEWEKMMNEISNSINICLSKLEQKRLKLEKYREKENEKRKS